MRARARHLDPRRRVGDAAERGGRVRRRAERGVAPGPPAAGRGSSGPRRRVSRPAPPRSRLDRLLARAAGGDHLGQQRVVGRGDLGAGLDPAVDADAGREHGPGDRAGARLVAGGRILGVDTGLNRVAAATAAESGAATSNIVSSPPASRSIHSTRSIPNSSSVTVCSTCRRALTSRNEASPRSES